MSLRIPNAALSKVPYLDVPSIQGRDVNLMPLWDGARWRAWVPVGADVREMEAQGAEQLDYVATEPARPTDVIVPFIEFMWQHGSWPEVAHFIPRARSDIHNLATSLAKIDHFFLAREMIGRGVAHFVQTEIEYLLTVGRSLFDLLQEVVAGLWSRVELDPSVQARKRGLHPSFRKMVLKSNEPRSAEELVAEYALPPSLAEFYVATGDFFLWLRRARDEIVHRGTMIDPVFVTDRGFCVNPLEKPYGGFTGWKPEHRYNHALVSLRPFLAHLVFGSIDACNFFVDRVAAEIRFPPPIAPAHRVFVRNYHNQALLDAKRVAEGGWPWWVPEKSEPAASP